MTISAALATMATSQHNNPEKLSPWLTEPGMTDRLVALHGNGETFGTMRRILADEYQKPLTRNQVAGKVYRLKLPRREAVVAPRGPTLRKPRPPRAPLPQFSDGRPGSPWPSVPPPPPPIIELLPPLLPASTLPLAELRCESLPVVLLTSRECKYPEGGYPFQFCGRPRIDGSAYCDGHRRIILRSPGEGS